jgi:predicted enzyme related to lactoylglutathione lyase
MVKRLAIAVVVGSFVASTLGCASEQTSKNAPQGRSADMRVAEHDVFYLEIVTPEVEAACRLYAAAYGWQFLPAAPELGNARVATLPDGSLCGIRAPMRSDEAPVVRTYIRVMDVEIAVKQAEQLGAEIALEPTDIPGRGRIAIYFLGGIQQGIWQLP